ncbi:GTP 3',8-cyclase MoaA [Crassaminicella profunda]|uniref:GTP 3',8-cyclase MoaA n=1 Tax=Crassaminicella profunda TaxID=1286698 RepID=UPI001CA6F9BB|nr:GTP 3',8-cyclase MoaA [Crassaminicella profunda]QZY54040.1 GTP 3',8-cyclase MoaA [Crassaminicella profunda]
MIDQFGRNINYFRISVTDQCNLRCIYCMPDKGIDFLQEEKLLSFDEIYRIVKIGASLGISKVRITGGEPLTREGLPKLIQKIKTLPQIEEVCLTTNGILLEKYIDELIKAGLDRVNISLDTLQHERYKQMTRGGNIEEVIRGIKLSLDGGIKRVRLNIVIIKEENDDEIMDFVELAEKNPIDIRFIELMPIGEGKQFKSVSNDEVKEIIMKERELIPYIAKNKSLGPAAYFKTPNSKGMVGFISPMSHIFCSQCNRMRLTSEGFLRQCLHWKDGIDLRKMMRDGMEDKQLKKIIAKGVYKKPNEHGFKKDCIDEDSKRMFQIGG